VSYLFVYPRLEILLLNGWKLKSTKPMLDPTQRISQQKVLVSRIADGLATALLFMITSLLRTSLLSASARVSLRGTPSIEFLKLQAAEHEGQSYR
jgi:hypothetical protein